MPPPRGGTPGTDVFLAGLLYFDLGFTGLHAAPKPGAEVHTEAMGTSPGGIANFAVALSRLGLRTSLAACFGDDAWGDRLHRTLGADEGIDLSRSRTFADWPTPVTVALAYDGDRALVTHEQPQPVSQDALVGQPPPSRAAVVHLGPEPQEWVGLAHRAGTPVFGDVGWDPTGRWDPAVLDQLTRCHGFFPNAEEAMAYTRTGTPKDALHRLSERVPLAVVTCGADGAIAVDASTGETAEVAALPVVAVDSTGAGDVFGAALVAGSLAGLPLADRLRLAVLVAGLSVRRIGGAAAAPDLRELAGWWRATSCSTAPGAELLRRDYGFLADFLDGVPDTPTDAGVGP